MSPGIEVPGLRGGNEAPGLPAKINPIIEETASPPLFFPPRAPEKLTAALAAIMAEVGVIQKTGYNAYHKYRYAAMQDVLGTLTPLLAKHGVIVMQTEAAKTMFDQDRVIAIEYEFTVAHLSGEVWPDRPRQTGMSGCRTRDGKFDDKCTNKCHTAARKYFLMALFQIATGEADDPDKGENDSERRPRAAPDAMKSDLGDYPSHTDPGLPLQQHDPQTGEIKRDLRWMPPHEIDTRRDGKHRKFLDWTQDYISGITYATTMTELAEWQTKNVKALDYLHKDPKGAGLHKRIVDVTSKVIDNLSKASEPAPEHHQNEPSAG